MGKAVFFHCSYIQCNIPPINTQLTALYLCPVLLHTAITVYLARSKMQSNNVICSLPLIARIYLQIGGGYKYKRLHLFTICGIFVSFLQIIFEILFLLITRNQNLMGSVPVFELRAVVCAVTALQNEGGGNQFFHSQFLQRSRREI